LPYLSRNFTWVVGFSATILSPIKVTLLLPGFVELLFLCGSLYSLQEAICRSFDRVDLLTHTGIIMIQLDTKSSQITWKEFVLSNQDRPWGLKLPECPSCNRVDWVKAKVTKNSLHSLRCTRCHSSTTPITKPQFVLPCKMLHLYDRKYFIIPFPEPGLSVDTKKWTVKKYVYRGGMDGEDVEDDAGVDDAEDIEEL
jgi:hypothetical protein